MATIIIGRAVVDGRLLEDARVIIDGGTIHYAGPAEGAPYVPAGAEEIIHSGLILPGLIDIHNHGGGGIGFPDAMDADDARTAIAEHARHGTTTLVASLVTAAHATLTERIGTLAPLVRGGELAGIHLEGPHISQARRGAHDPELIRPGSVGALKELLDAGDGTIVTMTLAPEDPQVDPMSEALIEAGALPSYGHTDCSAYQMLEAIAFSLQAGAIPTATHLFNGMRPIHHRDAGPAFACLDASARGDMVVELIADGVHTSADTVRFVFDLAGEDMVLLITDAMAATGMADGSYRLGSLDVTVADGTARLTHGGSIAGGTAHLLDVVRFAVRDAGVDLGQAVRAASSTPARVLGLSDRGALSTGLRADVVLTDGDLRPERVMRAGQWI